eukprot:CAMPEP_0119520682 /NCGR_PEP_ID=MMETSP1344-20130328/36635_1 /TAXON_ID=236787 /ORGANISM="Florenciella parvula, Strain CCMP2471" /LENGTH=64 /DNA_ID=CAMNT_0007558599 /DNA_START=351 /DNA_END=545 /DNA_ORIENTATION=-
MVPIKRELHLNQNHVHTRAPDEVRTQHEKPSLYHHLSRQAGRLCILERLKRSVAISSVEAGPRA